MSIESSGEFIDFIKRSLGASSSLLEPEEYEHAALQALNELGWSYPIDDSRRQFWAIKRGKRHSLDIIRNSAADEFKYKQISLNQRFEHFNTLIRELDQEFYDALNEDPILLDVDMTNFFGQYLGNGLYYDEFGHRLW